MITDTNSVICKIIVGADAHIRLRVDVGIDPYEKRRKIYETDPSRTILIPIDRFCWAIHSVTQRITAVQFDTLR